MAAVLGTTTPAAAATIILNNLGGVDVGTQAYQGFTTAANFWAKEIANPITINLNVGFAHLGPSILGQTNDNPFYAPTALIENQIVATGQSAIDATAAAHLPVPSAAGGIGMVTPGYLGVDPSTGHGLGVDTTKLVFDNNDTFNNTHLTVTSANLKALGFTGFGSQADGSVVFSSDFPFDFNPTDGVPLGKIDFLAVAVHEIGHALGFDSGVDLYDLLGSPNGPLLNNTSGVCGTDALGNGISCSKYDTEADAFAQPLDLFRYANDPLKDGSGPQLTVAPGVDSYFSVDGGATDLGGFSTGAFNGDGAQASHWKAPQSGNPCQNFLGIMNPYICDGEEGIVTPLDFDALDAIGYNFVFGNNVPTLTTAQISRQFRIAPLPEPATWAAMVVGFGLVGAAMRRRRRVAIA